MAGKYSRGSIILEILIVLLSLLLIAVILVPNKIWKEEEQITNTCREHINSLYEAEAFYYRANESYTDSLNKLLNFVQSDSGLHQRQTLVSLTRSFITVINNILEIPSIKNISDLSLAAYEITGDLVGNERYFRKYEDILIKSQEIMRDMQQFDSSATFPNFSRTKLFVDSLRELRERVSDYSLQNGILKAINYVDSINYYFPNVEREKVNQFWSEEYQKISKFISNMKKTDITKVSSVPDRLKKFIDRINTSLAYFTSANVSEEQAKLSAERQNLEELHQKFLSPEFFILTQKYGLSKLNETDSILVHLNQDDFYCPDCNELYLIDTTDGKHITVECPNLLDKFHQRFVQDVEPIKNVAIYAQIDSLDSVIARTNRLLNVNRLVLRRKTDILLDLKEIQAEFADIENVFFYRYAKEVGNFVKLVQTEKKLSVLKPAIEDILNPMDTLATRIETGNLSDLEKKLTYFQKKLEKLDSTVAAAKLSRRFRKKYKSSAEAFQPAMALLVQMKQSFNPDEAALFRESARNLEKDLLRALEGEKEPVYVIFYKKHINHGYIKDGEKSWENQ
jgi:competence protein ComGC